MLYVFFVDCETGHAQTTSRHGGFHVVELWKTQIFTTRIGSPDEGSNLEDAGNFIVDLEPHLILRYPWQAYFVRA